MKLSELLKRLETIKSQYGDLDVDVMVGEDWGPLEDMTVEERATLILFSDSPYGEDVS